MTVQAINFDTPKASKHNKKGKQSSKSVPAANANKENLINGGSSTTNWRRRSISAPTPSKVGKPTGSPLKLSGGAWQSLAKSQERRQAATALGASIGKHQQSRSACASPRHGNKGRSRAGSITSVSSSSSTNTSASSSSSSSPSSPSRSLNADTHTLFLEQGLKPVRFYTPNKYRTPLISTEETHQELTQAIKKANHSTTTPTPTPTSTPEATLNPSAVTFAPQGSESPFNIHNPLGGKLSHFASRFFKQAYGLSGSERRSHKVVIAEAMEITQCSERAILEVLYGHSYSKDLQPLRELVVGYPAKVRNKDRAECLKKLLDDLENQPFYHFDGNTQQPETQAANTTTTATTTTTTRQPSSASSSPVALTTTTTNKNTTTNNKPKRALMLRRSSTRSPAATCPGSMMLTGFALVALAPTVLAAACLL